MADLYFLSITNIPMNIAIIIVGLTDARQEADRTARAFRALRLPKSRVFVVLNQRGVQGYATGANTGIRQALQWGADIIIVANTDIRLIALTRSAIMRGVRQYDIWGYRFMQHGRVYSHGILDPWRRSGSLVTLPNLKQSPSVEYVSGSLICFRSSVVQEIGLFDETYHMYYEDVEFCQRARAAGYSIGVVPTTAYEHLESGHNPDKELQLFRSRLRFFLKTATITQRLFEFLRLPQTIFENRALIIHEFRRRPFIKNFMTLNLSSLSIKLFTFVLFLVLVRRLRPDAFGLYNLVWAQVALFMPLADLGTTNYGIFHLKQTNQSLFRKLFSLRLLLGIIFAVITIGYTAVVFRSPTILVLTILSVPIMLSNAVSGSYLIFSTLQAKAYLASYYSMGYNFVLITSLILYLQISHELTALFFIEGALALLYSLFLIRKTYGAVPFVFSMPPRSFVTRTVRQSYIYVLLTFFAGLYFKLDLFILQVLKGPAAVGLYSSGYKFFEALIFIGSSYTIAATPIYRAFLARKSTRARVRSKLLRDVLILFFGGLGVSITAAWLAPIVIAPLIGVEFGAGLAVFRTVIFALPFLLVSAVCMNVLYLIKKTHWVVQLFVVQIVFNLIANSIFVPLFSYHASAIITVVSEVLNAVAVLPLALKAYEDLD